MKDTNHALIIALFCLVPYLLISWAYVELSNGTPQSFWIALGLLIAVRFLFAVIEAFGGAISWHLYGKKIAVTKFLTLLQANNFPKRRYQHGDFLDYLASVENDSHADSIKASVREWRFLLSTFETMGVLVGMRMHAASEAALEMYSPRVNASTFGMSP